MRPVAVRPAPVRLAFLVAAVVGVACSDNSDIGPGGVVSIRIVPETLHVVLGRVDTASAFPLDGDSAFLSRKGVSWSIANSGVATVNDDGEVLGVAVGTTDISASASGVTGTGVIVVDPLPTVTFLPDTARLIGIAGSPNDPITSDTVSNAGGGSINGLTVDSITYLGAPTGWLQATLIGSFTPALVDLTANATTLGLGRHEARVWVSSPDATPVNAAMPVVMTLGADVASNIVLQAGNGQTQTVNTTLTTRPAVRVTDQFDNPVSGVAVDFAVTGGNGAVTGGATTTDGNGIATVGGWTLGTTAGANQVTASSAGLNGSPVVFTATGLAGAAAQIAINVGDNQAAVAGTAVSVPPSVRVSDQFGNAVSGTAVAFAVASGGGSITGPNQITNGSGIATVGSWTLGPTAGPNTLTASSAGLFGSPVTITGTGNPGNATDIALFSGDNQSATVNTAVAAPYVVRVTDINTNPVQGVTVGWAVASGGGSIAPPSSVTDVNGLATATRTLGTGAGTQTATATVAGLFGSPVTFTATGNPGTVTQITVFAGNGQSATVNTTVATNPAAVARDAFLNPVPGVALTFSIIGGGGVVNCGAGNTTACNVTTNAVGVASVTTWTMGTTAGANTLQASRSGASSVNFNATGTPGAVASIIIFAGNGQSVRPGAALPTDPSAQVRDAFSNLVPNATVTFSIIAGGGLVNCGAGNTTACNATSNGSGVATATSWSLGSAGLPTAGAPANGRYTNNLRAASNGVFVDFTAFSAWSFAVDVQPIFTGRCTSCHFTGGTFPNLSSGNAYAAMRGVDSGGCGFYVPIGFNTAGSSFLFNKLITASPCSGSQMPADGTAPLSATQINIIRDWINNSSPNN